MTRLRIMSEILGQRNYFSQPPNRKEIEEKIEKVDRVTTDRTVSVKKQLSHRN